MHKLIRAEDAARFRSINYSLDHTPFHIVETRVPTAFANSIFSGTADRMPYLAVNPEQLSELNVLGKVSIWNQLPLMVKPCRVVWGRDGGEGVPTVGAQRDGGSGVGWGPSLVTGVVPGRLRI